MNKILIPFKLENTAMYRERMSTLTSIRKLRDCCFSLESCLDVPRNAVDLLTANEDLKELEAEMESLLEKLK